MSRRLSCVSSLRRCTSSSCTASAVAAPAIAGRLKRRPRRSMRLRRRLPHAQERDDRAGRQQRGDDVGQLDRDVVRAHELADREREAADDRRRPAPGARRACRRPCRPGSSGTTRARNGVWRPTIAPRSSFGRPVISDSVMIGVAIAPNATGAVLATSATAAACIGLKPTASEHHGRDRHRRAEAGQRLDQRAEAERDDRRPGSAGRPRSSRTSAAARRSARSRRSCCRSRSRSRRCT